jgi:hypothetical protein
VPRKHRRAKPPIRARPPSDGMAPAQDRRDCILRKITPGSPGVICVCCARAARDGNQFATSASRLPPSTSLTRSPSRAVGWLE